MTATPPTMRTWLAEHCPAALPEYDAALRMIALIYLRELARGQADELDLAAKSVENVPVSTVELAR